MINIFFVFQRNLNKMGEENILNLNWNNFGDNLSSLVKELICQQEFLEFYGIERNKFGGRVKLWLLLLETMLLI